jgi:hypothetical protein
LIVVFFAAIAVAAATVAVAVIHAAVTVATVTVGIAIAVINAVIVAPTGINTVAATTVAAAAITSAAVAAATATIATAANAATATECSTSVRRCVALLPLGRQVMAHHSIFHFAGRSLVVVGNGFSARWRSMAAVGYGDVWQCAAMQLFLKWAEEEDE